MKPAEKDIVRRAYEFWEKAGKPDGSHQGFYHQAESELKEAPDGPEMPHQEAEAGGEAP